MRIRLLAPAMSLGLAACGAKLPETVDVTALAEAVGTSIGDPSTCVVVVEKASAKQAWKGGASTACHAKWPACTRPETQTVFDLAQRAAKGETAQTGCQSVSWAAGPIGTGPYAYAAAMYGERALPGREIARRLERVFEQSGFK